MASNESFKHKEVFIYFLVCFKVFDMDQDGYLSKAELIGAIEASFTVLQQNDHSEVITT